MISALEASLEMTRLVNNSFSYMRKKGFILPSILVASKGKPIDIEISHEGVLAVSTNYDLDEFSEPSPDVIYEYGISLRLDESYKDSILQEISNKIVEEYNPDCIGVISACLLRSDVTTDSIRNDPNALRVMYMNYYLRGDKVPKFMCIPYIRSKLEEPMGWGNDSFCVLPIHTSWNMGVGVEDLLIQYPYSK